MLRGAHMLIVDAQVHIWGADSPDRPWPPGRAAEPQKPYPVTREMVLTAMDDAGVDRAVLIPPSWEGDYNDLVLEAARSHPDRFAAMGRLAVQKPESRALVAGWKAQPGMLGIRLTFHIPEHRKMLFDSTVDWLWPAAERAGVPIMVYAPTSVRKIEEIAARHPGVCRTGRCLPACALSQRRSEGVGTAVSLDTPVSVPRSPSAHPPCLRCLRPQAHVLGDRLDATPVSVARGRDALHRRARVAHRGRQGLDHGPRIVPVDRVGNPKSQAPNPDFQTTRLTPARG